MCGIAGIFARRQSKQAHTPTREELARMCGAMHHRGPDEFGVYRDARCGLAHARLSIIDLSTGQQPLANEDGTLWIAFNGEIFNYVELRAELETLGHAFHTKSDTEVIVHAYEAWGDDAFARMNGQWAVALWDEKQQKLVLCRDRVGVRPLYICEHEGRVFFGSEVKAIFAADASIPRAFDPIGIEQTFTFWSVVPPQTVFRGVEELRPGWVRTYTKAGEVSERPYWEPSYAEPNGTNAFKGSLEDATVAVREALEKATALRMLRADVQVGSYLSGGLDSSFIAALGLRAKGEKFATFSVGFEDAEYDETQYQRQMAERLGTEHHSIVVKRGDIARVFPDVIRYAERPVLRTAPAPLFLLSKLVHEAGIKVVLTGEGADEMFAGYDLFREGKVRRFWAKQPQSKSRPLLLDRLYPYLARSPVAQKAMAVQFFGKNLEGAGLPGFAHEARWRSTGALKRLFAPAVQAEVGARDVAAELLATLPPAFKRWSTLAQDQYLEIRTLLTGYLLSSQGDRMLMGNSVEGRFPFLDKDVIALADSLPAHYKLRVLDEKHILKRASRDLVPADILARKKQPYRAPDALSFVDEAGAPPEWAAALMSEAAIAEAGVFSVPSSQTLWKKCLARAASGQFSNADNMAVVGMLSTQLVHEHIVARPAAPRVVPIKTVIDRLA
ncbi:MAG: asparagine synthase (glutamine-hydrolyzing) [Myxococcales bacterium]|nr:asparagine synthase (glutamine-hydrolyzing) [Myxococcales bacterium]HQY64014.1 asparagine synthase (glutamine-hydrolyzing) [Polyangiaceae bacterium]